MAVENTARLWPFSEALSQSLLKLIATSWPTSAVMHACIAMQVHSLHLGIKESMKGRGGEGGSIHVIVHIRQDTCPPLVVCNSAMMAIFTCYKCTTTIGRKITNRFNTVVQQRGPSSVK